MSTNQQTINNAMFHIGAVDSGNDATPEESADMLAALNKMMAMWAQQDKDLNFPPQDTLSDTLPAPLWAEEAIEYNLAIRGATLFSLPVTPDVAVMARESASFIAQQVINLNLKPADMSHMPYGEGNRWNILTDEFR